MSVRGERGARPPRDPRTHPPIPHSFLESSFWIQQKAGMGDGEGMWGGSGARSFPLSLSELHPHTNKFRHAVRGEKELVSDGVRGGTREGARAPPPPTTPQHKTLNLMTASSSSALSYRPTPGSSQGLELFIKFISVLCSYLPDASFSQSIRRKRM